MRTYWVRIPPNLTRRRYKEGVEGWWLVAGVLPTPSVAQYVKCVLGAPGLEEDVLLDSGSMHRSTKIEHNFT